MPSRALWAVSSLCWCMKKALNQEGLWGLGACWHHRDFVLALSQLAWGWQGRGAWSCPSLLAITLLFLSAAPELERRPCCQPHRPSPLPFPHSRRNCAIQALQDPGASSARMLRLLGLPSGSSEEHFWEQGPPGRLRTGREHGRSPSFRPAAMAPHIYVTQAGCASSSRLKERLASASGLLASL